MTAICSPALAGASQPLYDGAMTESVLITVLVVLAIVALLLFIIKR